MLIESAIIGAILGAVSHAVVVPKMVSLLETHYGTNKSISQFILAADSLDDVFVIVLFTTFVGMAQGGSVSAINFINIPISIVFGIALGAVIGWLLGAFFEIAYAHKHLIRNSTNYLLEEGKSTAFKLAEKLGASIRTIIEIGRCYIDLSNEIYNQREE